eukprot:c10617_g1_i2.p1 GENE.c10617_g1_i2~~c10617_g1_i2.p1  ORF type:complete len:128 (-),score=15.61 c10617_g1_i2:370-720(-)
MTIASRLREASQHIRSNNGAALATLFRTSELASDASLMFEVNKSKVSKVIFVAKNHIFVSEFFSLRKDRTEFCGNANNILISATGLRSFLITCWLVWDSISRILWLHSRTQKNPCS